MADQYCYVQRRGRNILRLAVLAVLVVIGNVSCVGGITNVAKHVTKPVYESPEKTSEEYQDNELKSTNLDENLRSSRANDISSDRNTNKDRPPVKNKDSSGSSSQQYDRRQGFFAPEEQAYQGYGYQDFDHGIQYNYGVPSVSHGSHGGGGGSGGLGGGSYYYLQHGGGGGGHDFQQDHRDHHYGPEQEQHKYGHDPHGLALKGLLLPLAGAALLGVAAALVTNPILLQLGVISGRKKRSVVEDIFRADKTNPLKTGYPGIYEDTTTDNTDILLKPTEPYKRSSETFKKNNDNIHLHKDEEQDKDESKKISPENNFRLDKNKSFKIRHGKGESSLLTILRPKSIDKKS